MSESDTAEAMAETCHACGASPLREMCPKLTPPHGDPKRCQPEKPRCPHGLTPPEWTGHWRDWHRGHGCHLDPGPRKKRLVVHVTEVLRPDAEHWEVAEVYTAPPLFKPMEWDGGNGVKYRARNYIPEPDPGLGETARYAECEPELLREAMEACSYGHTPDPCAHCFGIIAIAERYAERAISRTARKRDRVLAIANRLGWSYAHAEEKIVRLQEILDFDEEDACGFLEVCPIPGKRRTGG